MFKIAQIWNKRPDLKLLPVHPGAIMDTNKDK